MELKNILESLLFSAQKPLSIKEIRDVFAGASEDVWSRETNFDFPDPNPPENPDFRADLWAIAGA